MALVSTAYFPPISWMALLFQKGELNLDIWETYPKQTYRNRSHIVSANGLMTLTVPVIKTYGNQTKTIQAGIDYKQNWPLLHWRSIKTAYQSSPYFLYYQDEIESLFQKKYQTLHEMNEHIIKELISLMGFSAKLNITTEFIPIDSKVDDFRFLIHPKKPKLFQMGTYHQVFEEKYGFLENLSVLDLLFNEGPESIFYLEKVQILPIL